MKREGYTLTTMTLYPELNRVIMALAPKHTARAIAPSTLLDLHNAPSLIVWDGACDQTIYGDARVNHAYRAWHDSIHLANNFELDWDGEIATCNAQIVSLYRAFPRAPAMWARIMRAEIVGQLEHLRLTGAFPSDQIAFVQAYLERATP